MDDRQQDTARPGVPAVLALQPAPLKTRVCRLDGITAISRTFRRDDHLRCGLCPQCSATEIPGTELVGCLVQTSEPVSDADAPLFRAPAAAGHLRGRSGSGAG